MTAWLIGAVSAPAWGAEIISVRVLVDEEEATNERSWRDRLSARVKAASDIISRYADVRFVVTEFARWSSDNRIQDFSRSLREFEQEVDTGGARLAIGFSSQYRFTSGRNHLGGTRGPLQSHILIRENAPTVFEPERLEVLVHELGHYLGAAHSAAPTSVMRPVVGDGQARAKAFDISFDRQNARIIRMVAAEIRDRKIERYEQLSPHTLMQIRGTYAELARALPRDSSSPKYLHVIDTLLSAHAAARKAAAPKSPAGTADEPR